MAAAKGGMKALAHIHPGFAREDVLQADHAGACAWVSVFKPHYRRAGPAAVHLPCVPSWSFSYKGDIFATLHHIGEVSKGISLTNMEGWLSTPKGETYFRNEATTLYMPEKSMLWLPACYYVAYTAIPKSDKLSRLACIASVPMVRATALADIPEALIDAVQALQDETFEAKRDSAMWTRRKEYVADVWKAPLPPPAARDEDEA